MGKLIVYYGVMGSSKTAQLILEKFNLEEANLRVAVLKSNVDTKAKDYLHSRFVGKSNFPVSVLLDPELSIIENFEKQNFKITDFDFLLIDEAQFLTPNQAYELYALSKSEKIDLQILCYGLLANFKQEIFPASEILFVNADEKYELTRRCQICGKTVANNTARKVNGTFTSEGEVVVIADNNGGNSALTKQDKIDYYALCGYCRYKLLDKNNEISRQVEQDLKRLTLSP